MGKFPKSSYFCFKLKLETDWEKTYYEFKMSQSIRKQWFWPESRQSIIPSISCTFFLSVWTIGFEIEYESWDISSFYLLDRFFLTIFRRVRLEFLLRARWRFITFSLLYSNDLSDNSVTLTVRLLFSLGTLKQFS